MSRKDAGCRLTSCKREICVAKAFERKLGVSCYWISPVVPHFSSWIIRQEIKLQEAVTSPALGYGGVYGTLPLPGTPAGEISALRIWPAGKLRCRLTRETSWNNGISGKDLSKRETLIFHLCGCSSCPWLAHSKASLPTVLKLPTLLCAIPALGADSGEMLLFLLPPLPSGRLSNVPSGKSVLCWSGEGGIQRAFGGIHHKNQN